MTTQPDPHNGRSATLSAAALHGLLGRDDLAVLDVRSIAAFNGWRLSDEARGGHVPGAIAAPSAWLETLDDAELERALRSRGVTPARPVVVYDEGSGDAAAGVSRRLGPLGHGSVATLDGGWAAWAAASELPVEVLPNHASLIHVDWLRQLIDGTAVEAAPEGRWLLFHVNFGDPKEYEQGHLPGALYLDTNWLEDPADWNRRPPAELDTALRSLGITHDTTVILYGRDTGSHPDEQRPGRRAGRIAATRVALILHYAGVDDVRVLDGGYDQWVRAGGSLETIMRTAAASVSFGATIPKRPELLVDIEAVKDLLADLSGAVLADVRTWREHIGAVSGYDYIDPAGRIPGAVWGGGGPDADDKPGYGTVDDTMRPYTEIAADWGKAGITPAKRVAFYCGTGWRASEAWFYAYLMGWPRIAVYDGGWYEWSRDPVNNPIEVGAPKD